MTTSLTGSSARMRTKASCVAVAPWRVAYDSRLASEAAMTIAMMPR